MNTLRHLCIDEFHLAPGQEWHDESNSWRFVRLDSGTAYWLRPGPARFFAEGEMVIVAPEAAGAVRASQLSEVVMQGFSFAPELLCGFFTLAERRFLERKDALPQAPAQFLPSIHPLNQRFAALVLQGEKSPELLKRVEVLALATALFAEKMGDCSQSGACSISAQTRFQQLIAQMPDMELINYSLEQLARLCACSSRHFTRLFRQQFGESLRAYQAKLRLLIALQLLWTTEERITLVSLKSGFRSQSLFNALFKKHFGMSPSEWRQKAGKKRDGLPLLGIC